MKLTYLVKPKCLETLAIGTLRLKNGPLCHTKIKLGKKGKFVP
jgi:hypothetical protein